MLTTSTAKRGGLVLLVTGLVLGLASPAFAPPQAIQVRHVHNGGSINGVVVVTETASFSTNSVGFVNVPGAVGSVTIPAGQSALVKAQYDAESACFEADTDPNWCSIRIVIGGVEGNPASGNDFAFDSTNRGRESNASWEGHGMTRVRCIANTSGSTITVFVVVQAAVTNAGGDASRPVFRLDDWELDIYRTSGCAQTA
jgi:hypothetical protein